MICDYIGYGYNDVTIAPAVISNIKSRKEVNPFDLNGKLPIFASPMASIVSTTNFEIWENNKIIPVLPRNVVLESRLEYLNNGKWVSLSLSEFNDIFCNDNSNIEFNINKKQIYYVCIDLANGHMKSLIDSCIAAKNRYKNLVIMTGNIANPQTYELYCNAGIDYVRCSIGSGSCCTTSSNTAIHYPIASLLDEINYIKKKRVNEFKTKVIADGGIRNFNDVNKALALGADYVMIGGLFASILESVGEIIDGDKLINFNKPNDYEYDIKILNQYHDADYLFNKIIIKGPLSMSDKFDIYKDCEGVETLNVELNGGLIQYYFIFDIYNPNLHEAIKRSMVDLYKFKRGIYGMSTKIAQKQIKSDGELKTAEGISKTVNITYTMKQWVENMEAYLRSCMSYCNSLTLEDFIGNQKIIANSPGEMMSVNK